MLIQLGDLCIQFYCDLSISFRSPHVSILDDILRIFDNQITGYLLRYLRAGFLQFSVKISKVVFYWLHLVGCICVI